MKKVLGQTLFVVFLIFILKPAFAKHSPLQTAKVSTTYKLFKPLFEAVGYRPLKVHVVDQETGDPISDAVVMIGDR